MKHTTYMRILAVGLMLNAGLTVSCQKSPVNKADQGNPPNVRELRVAEKQTLQNANTFAFRAFSELNAMKPADENLFISPLSLSMAVAMTYNGANGTTKEGIKKALSLDKLTDQELNSSFQSLAAYLPAIDKTVTFTSANAIWYANKFTPQASFVQKNQEYFAARVEGLNFSDAETAKRTMNGWVKEKTNGKIENIVDQVRPEHRLFLMNAIYFKGKWNQSFDKDKTYQGPFSLPNGGTTQASFMSAKMDVSYVQDADKVLVNLPYGNKQFVMTLIMPAEGKPLPQLMTGLQADQLSSWLAKAYTGNKQVVVPKFTVKGDYADGEFNTILTRLGMGEAFTDQADFSNMLEGFTKGQLAITEVAHKTFIEVNEEGTEAAAATSVGVGVTSVDEPLVFNRPFIYLIREKDSGAILFMGKLAKP